MNDITKGAKRTRSAYKQKSPTRGGARPGAGRPKGSGHKYDIQDLLAHIEMHTGQPFAERVAVNYALAIQREDWGGVRDYDRVLLGKLVADKQAVEVTDSAESVEAKKAAFADALASMTGIKKE